MLTDFQTMVAQLFFTLPASDGFLLAGGAALLAHQLTTRPTQDLDFFTSRGKSTVTDARDQFEDAADTRGWTVDRIHDTDNFCRILVPEPEDLLIDLAVDSPPGMPATASIAGPTFAPNELAGRKLVALFDRAEARDFADVYTLTTRYDKNTLLTLAADVDTGFDHHILATMIDSLQRFTDDDIPVDAGNVADLRRFFAAWATEIRQHRVGAEWNHPSPHLAHGRRRRCVIAPHSSAHP